MSLDKNCIKAWPIENSIFAIVNPISFLINPISTDKLALGNEFSELIEVAEPAL